MGIKNNRLIFEMEFDILEKNKNPINNNGKDVKKIQDYKWANLSLFVIMHNKFSLSVILNAVKDLKKIPHCVRNDKFLCNFQICSFIVQDLKFQKTLHYI